MQLIAPKVQCHMLFYIIIQFNLSTGNNLLREIYKIFKQNI